MKAPILAAALVAFAGPGFAQSTAPAQPQAPPAPSRMETPAAQSRMGSMMGSGMMGGSGMASPISPEDMGAFLDAHIAGLKAGLKLSPDQEKLWPPVEEAMRHLAQLHISHMQAMRQSRGAMADEPVDMLRSMSGWMGQGADAMRKLADAAAPLYATLDAAQKRRLPVLMHMGLRDMMGGRMMGRTGTMMPGRSDHDDDDDEDAGPLGR